MTSLGEKAAKSAVIISVLLIIEILDATFGKMIGGIIPCSDRDNFQLPCELCYHIWIIIILSFTAVFCFIYWISSTKLTDSFATSKISLSRFSLKNFKRKIKIESNQRIFNLIITASIIIYYLMNFKYFYYASGLNVYYKFRLLTIVLCLFILQTILNQRWLNYLINFLFISMLSYVLYTFIYAFFDPYDVVMKRENGLLIKSWQFIVKSALIIFAIWITSKLTPMKTYATNTK